MFEIYLNDKRELLVIEKGTQVPVSPASGKWRKRKKTARVSDAIRSAVESQGYYLRKLNDRRSDGPF